MSSTNISNDNKKSDYQFLLLILLITFFHGLVYVLIMPPWQHYDEPNHFEYAWLVAKMDRLPDPKNKDYEFNRLVMESMMRVGFFKGVGYQPQLDDSNKPIELFGHSQLSDPPLYYLIVSLPLRIFYFLPIESQLILTRLFSMYFLLLTVISAWGIARTMTKIGNPLRWMLPLTLALLPGFIELMTAVNNIVAAVGFFSFFLWGSVRLINKKISALNVVWVLTSALLSYLTNNTVIFVLLLLPFVLLLAFMRNKKRKVAWILIAFGLLLAFIISVRWGEAAYWYRFYIQSDPISLKSDSAVIGKNVFNIDASKLNQRTALFHIIPENKIVGLAGKEVTLGGWMWASKPVTVSTPVLVDPSQSSYQEITLETYPKFFSLSTVLPQGSYRIEIKINPRVSDEIQPVVVYYDGLFLVEGYIDSKTKITYEDDTAKEIGWNDEIKENLIRNGSAEQTWVRLIPALDNLSTKFYLGFVITPTIITSLFDFSGSGSLYYTTIQRLFRTFWAEFGWGHISISPTYLYLLLLIFTLIGIIGFFINVWRKRCDYPWDIAFIFCLSLIFSWGLTIFRGVIYIDWQIPYIPVARYSYPVIIPTMFIIVCGWNEWRYLIQYRMKNQVSPKFNKLFLFNGRVVCGFFYFVLLIVLIFSLLSIISYYQSSAG
jgi:hypothetical protein